jgi:hypothetical protein
MLPHELTPECGIVDWFVEDAVGNADDSLLRSMVADSPLASDCSGSIVVAPCNGGTGGDYLAKLSRVYLDLPPKRSPRTFAERLSALVNNLETLHRPDVVLLDSRAGLHDIAAVATTRLGAMTFLFALGTRQTWDGYRILLNGWARRPDIAKDVRERIRVVASQIPETARAAYLDQFRQDSYDMFADILYEEAGPTQVDAFNYDIDAKDAPHDPLRINWSRPMQYWNPTAKEVTLDEVHASLGDFLLRATELVLPANTTQEEQELV